MKLCRSLGIEGVEASAYDIAVRECGTDFIQGQRFGRPLSVSDF